jgi:hypothetical protein
MNAAFRLTAGLSLLLSAAATPIGSSSALSSTRSTGDVKVPLSFHDTRQYSSDLEEKQDWLRQQALGLKRKYAGRLDQAGQEAVKRQLDEERVRLSKRASGTSQ